MGAGIPMAAQRQVLGLATAVLGGHGDRVAHRHAVDEDLHLGIALPAVTRQLQRDRVRVGRAGGATRRDGDALGIRHLDDERMVGQADLELADIRVDALGVGAEQRVIDLHGAEDVVEGHGDRGALGRDLAEGGAVPELLLVPHRQLVGAGGLLQQQCVARSGQARDRVAQRAGGEAFRRAAGVGQEGGQVVDGHRHGLG